MLITKKLRANLDLTLAFLFALITGIISPPNFIEMVDRLNLPLLGLLIFLMCIVAGLRISGFFTKVFEKFFYGEISGRTLSRFLIFACYFSSMLITNDVALIIFAPLAVYTFTELKKIRIIAPTVIWQTIAANMGSMLTPIGNPQNLFIYSHYNLSLGEFLSITAPIVFISGILIYVGTFFIEDYKLKLAKQKEKPMPKGKIAFLLSLFVICLLYVVRIVPFEIMALVVIPALLIFSPKLFLEADYKLILLFAALFIGVGNLANIPFFQSIPQNLNGHEFIVSLVMSQIISNVPATVLLSEFTNAYTPLLLGVNIGGLGTIIASMASVISFKAYMKARFSKPKYYLLSFTLSNLAVLFVLVLYYNY